MSPSPLLISQECGTSDDNMVQVQAIEVKCFKLLNHLFNHPTFHETLSLVLSLPFIIKCKPPLSSIEIQGC